MPPGTALARSLWGASESQGKSGRTREVTRGPPRSLVVRLRGQVGDDRVVLVDDAELRRAPGAAEVVEELDVRLVVVGPLLGDVVLVVDRLHRADRLARTAVDALVGVDVQRPLALVDAVDGTFLDAGLVLEVHARLGDHVRHAAHTMRRMSGDV